MSKSLRMLLLSAFIVVLAATSAMASNITFKWVGGTSTTTNYWGHANNWLIISDDKVVSYDRVSSKITKVKNDIEFYPGGFTVKDNSTNVYVVISKDANITMTNVSNVAGGLRDITSIDISDKVSLDMGSDSFFYDTPSISVSKDSGLKITGSHAQAFRITKNVKWEAVSSDLALYVPVSFVSDDANLSLDVKYGVLTIGDLSLLGYNGKRKTHITVSDTKSNPTAKLVLDVEATSGNASDGLALDIILKGTANRIDTLKDVTLNVHSSDVQQAISTDVKGSKTFVKGGAATLTLNKIANTYGRKDIPVVSADKFRVEGGTLKITGAGYAPLGHYATGRTVSFTVNNGATLDLGTKTISADAGVSVDITVASGGTVLFGDTAIDCGDNYDNGKLVTDATVNVTVNGVLRFAGSQAVKSVSGSGRVESTTSGAMLLLKGDSDDIKGFTGTLNGLDVGIVSSWDIIPFLTKASGDINNLYVFGPNGALTLDESKMKGIDEIEKTNIYLRSDVPGVPDYAQLYNLAIGELLISGDISLNVVSVDGTRSADAVGSITFMSNDARLTVNKLVLHANADKDFDASNQQVDNNNVYTNAYAIEISGPGTLVPTLIVNGATNNNVKVGQKDSITVDNGATLELRGGVKFPANNGLLLKGASIDVENNTRISGDFIVDGASRIRVSLTGANTREYAGEENINTAAIVVGETFKISGDSTLSIDITELVDAGKFLGKMYSLVGYNNLDIGDRLTVSLDNNVRVIGDYGLKSGDTKPAVNLGVSSKVIWAQLAKWMIKPVVYEWVVVSGDENSLGSANSQFKAVLRYGVSDDITPKDELLDCLIASITLRYDDKNSVPAVLSDGDARQSVRTADGEPLGFFKFDDDKANHQLILSGTSYVTELETLVNLRWSMSTSARSVYAKARVTTSTGGDLGQEFEHNGQVEPEDLINLVGESRILKNPSKTSDDQSGDQRSDDVYPEVTPVIVSPTTVFEQNASADFMFTIPGMTIVNNAATPKLLNGVYVWDNGASSTDKYMIDGEEVTDLRILVNGQPIPMADVTITPDNNGNVLVSIPVSLLGTANGYLPDYKTIEVLATAVTDGATIHIEGPTVTITAVYTDGEVYPEQKSRTVKTNQLPTSDQQVAEYPMTDPVSVDAVVDGGAQPEWLTLNVSGGVVAYALTANAPVGTHNITINVWNAEGAYKYEFTVTVEEGFRINSETVFDSTYAGLNYEAHFTTNAPAGTAVQWVLTTNLAWLKSANSGDMFVVYGQLPPYVDDEEAEEDPNEYTYNVRATADSDTATTDETINVEEDTDETIAYTDFKAGSVTPNGDITSAGTDYNVAIAFDDEDYYGELTFLSLPYWLQATPVTTVVDEEEVITGYTITYKNGVTVNAGEAGVVRFEDPNEGGIVSWNVTFNETITLQITASQTAFTLATGETATVTMSANLEGVTYTSNKSWAVVSGSTVTITAPSATDTVTITGTDAAGHTDTVTITVTVSVPVELEVTASETAFTLTVGATATVTMTANVAGVTYTSDKDWAVVDGSTVTITAPSATDTVTITGTDAAGHTDTVTITVTVSTPTTFSLQRIVSSVSFDISATMVSYDINALVRPVNNQGTVSYRGTVSPTAGLDVSIDDGVVTLLATQRGSYTVTITGTDAASQTASTTITVIVSGRTGTLGSSGGGCDAGFGALALALAVPLFLRRRRS